ncbi:unnamed protein product, partial [Prunus brigantina]
KRRERRECRERRERKSEETKESEFYLRGNSVSVNITRANTILLSIFSDQDQKFLDPHHTTASGLEDP